MQSKLDLMEKLDNELIKYMKLQGKSELKLMLDALELYMPIRSNLKAMPLAEPNITAFLNTPDLLLAIDVIKEKFYKDCPAPDCTEFTFKLVNEVYRNERAKLLAAKVQNENAAHKNVKYWYKFRNTIVFDGDVYDVTFNIRDKGKEQFQYLIDFKQKGKAAKVSHTVKKTSDLRYLELLSDNSVTQPGGVVKGENSSNQGKNMLPFEGGQREFTRTEERHAGQRVPGLCALGRARKRHDRPGFYDPGAARLRALPRDGGRLARSASGVARAGVPPLQQL